VVWEASVRIDKYVINSCIGLNDCHGELGSRLI
jgi:hypothetical protein